MSRNFAYRRVSTKDQNTSRQLEDCNVEFCAEFEDKLSGKSTDRPELKKCMNMLESGDTLWVHSIDRLARNTRDLLDIVFTLIDNNVKVKFIKEGLEFVGDLGDAMKAAISKMLITLLGAVAEFERSICNSRVKEGISSAKKRGVKFGAASPKYKKNNHVSVYTVKKTLEKDKDTGVISHVRKYLNFCKNSNVPVTLVSLGKELQREGFISNGGKTTWGGQTVSNMLKRNGIENLQQYLKQ